MNSRKQKAKREENQSFLFAFIQGVTGDVRNDHACLWAGRFAKGLSNRHKEEISILLGHQPAADGKITASCRSQWWIADLWKMENHTAVWSNT